MKHILVQMISFQIRDLNGNRQSLCTDKTQSAVKSQQVSRNRIFKLMPPILKLVHIHPTSSTKIYHSLPEIPIVKLVLKLTLNQLSYHKATINPHCLWFNHFVAGLITV